MAEQDKKARLCAEIERDTQKIAALQHNLKEKKRRLHELEQTEILSRTDVLQAQGLDVTKILDAIRVGDTETILTYVKRSDEDHE